MKSKPYGIAVLVLLTVTVVGCSLLGTGTYSVSGTVSLDGTGLEGVTIAFGGDHDSVITNALGAWTKAGLSGTVVVAPRKDGYTFSPPNMPVSASTVAVDFVAEPIVDSYAVSGTQLG